MFQRRRSRRKLRSGMSKTIPEALQCDQISQVKVGFRLYIHHDLDPLNSSKMQNYIYTILYIHHEPTVSGDDQSHLGGAKRLCNRGAIAMSRSDMSARQCDIIQAGHHLAAGLRCLRALQARF